MTQHRAVAQYLSFFVGGDEYGLALLDAREILQSPAISTVPSMSRCMRGITNLRGSVIPVVDLAAVLGHGTRPLDKWSCVVVVEVVAETTTMVGLLVEAIHRVFEVAEDQIEPPPTLGTRGRAQFLRGVTASAGTFVRLLELDRVIERVDVDIELPEEPQPVTDATTVESFDFLTPPTSETTSDDVESLAEPASANADAKEPT